VSYNKFLAKLASDHRKPDGLFVITPKMGPSFVETLPVRKFHGVGPVALTKPRIFACYKVAAPYVAEFFPTIKKGCFAPQSAAAASCCAR
jgi:hypothetical protein